MSNQSLLYFDIAVVGFCAVENPDFYAIRKVPTRAPSNAISLRYQETELLHLVHALVMCAKI